jgi:hypothetical protein
MSALATFIEGMPKAESNSYVTDGENAEAESDPALNSFHLRTTDLQPDEVATGTVVFDVPVEHARLVSAQGSDLIFVNYGDEAKEFPTGSQPLQALGYIRLWK